MRSARLFSASFRALIAIIAAVIDMKQIRQDPGCSINCCPGHQEEDYRHYCLTNGQMSIKIGLDMVNIVSREPFPICPQSPELY